MPADPRFHDVRPALLVRCRSELDVARAISHARDFGLRLVPRGGGHCFAGRSSTDGIVLDLAGLDEVTVTDDGRAIIGTGGRLGHVYARLHEHGRTIPAGCGASVGIAGLTLGGGIGLLGRTHGLTCDRLVGARVVLADGNVVDCDRGRHADLFWAPRGAGGGQFGVVTSLIFDTVPEPITTRFVVSWRPTASAEVIAAWQDWAPRLPEAVTADLTVVAEPGQPVRAILFGASLVDEPTTRELLEGYGESTKPDPDVDVRGGPACRRCRRRTRPRPERRRR